VGLVHDGAMPGGHTNLSTVSALTLYLRAVLRPWPCVSCTLLHCVWMVLRTLELCGPKGWLSFEEYQGLVNRSPVIRVAEIYGCGLGSCPTHSPGISGHWLQSY
jgi:hypothetical protein